MADSTTNRWIAWAGNQIADAIGGLSLGGVIKAAKTANEVHKQFQKWTGRDRVTIETISSDIAQATARDLAEHRIPDDKHNAVIANGTEVVRRFGPRPARLFELRNRPKQAADDALQAAQGPLLRGMGEEDVASCRRFVILFYERLLEHRKFDEVIEPGFREWVRENIQNIDANLAQLPDLIRSEILKYSADSLIDARVWPWPPKRGFASAAPGWHSGILRAEYGIVGLVGRDALIEDIREWCRNDAPLDIRLYAAVGGTGKTRLFRDTARQLANEGWRAGFLHPSAAQAPSEVLGALIDFPMNLFLVIDYAETRRDSVINILGKALRVNAGHRLRIVLLSRSPGDWWKTLSHRAQEVNEGRVKDALDALGGAYRQVPQAAPQPEDRAALFQQAVNDLATATKKEASQVALPDLNALHFDRALYVSIAALAALDGRSPSEADDLLDIVIDRDRAIWARGINPDHAEGIAQAMAVITVIGGAASEADALAVIAAIPILPRQHGELHRKIARLLHDLYPGDQWIAPMQPDLIGERLVETFLTDDLLNAVLNESAFTDRAKTVLTVLTRLAARRRAGVEKLRAAFTGRFERLVGVAINVAVETGDPIGRIAAERLLTDGTPTLAAIIEDRITAAERDLPSDIVTLRELSLAAAEILLKSPPLAPASSSPEDQVAHDHEMAFRLAVVAVRRSAVGRREEAEAAAREAVALYRMLAVARPEAFEPDLATSLNTHAATLSALGRREEAEATAREAVGLRRKLAAARPEAFEPDLAGSLNTHANMLRELGRREAAEAATREAVGLYGKLAAARPEAFEPYLAGSLNNHAAMLSALGRREEAEATAREAVGLRRKLAAARPEAFEPYLAGSLNTHAAMLSALGRREEAEATAREAVGLRRKLAAARPEAFEPYLAGSLNIHANTLSDLGRRENALQASDEAVRLLRPHFLALPSAHQTNMMVMVRVYLRHCRTLNRELDADLLEPILAKLAELGVIKPPE